MTPIQIYSSHQNQTVHKVSIDEPVLLALVIAHIAEELGIDATAGHVKVGTAVTSYRDGLGAQRTRIELEVVEDHAPA